MKENFYSKWEVIRESGMKKFYLSKLRGMLCVFLGMVCGDYLVEKEIDLLFLTIAGIVVMLFPWMAWLINETRYKIYGRQNK